nr:uncharacterized protein LOC100209977 isoform X3 [Hydra vulgaris]
MLISLVSSKINVLPDDFDLMFSDMVLEDKIIVALPNPCEIVVKIIESDPSFQRVTYEPTFLEMLNSVPIYSRESSGDSPGTSKSLTQSSFILQPQIMNVPATVQSPLSLEIGVKVCCCGFMSENNARMDRHLGISSICKIVCKICNASFKSTRGVSRHICKKNEKAVLPFPKIKIDSQTTFAIKLCGQLRVPSTTVNIIFSISTNMLLNIRKLIKEEHFHTFDKYFSQVDILSNKYQREKLLNDLFDILKINEVLFAGGKGYNFLLFDIINFLLQIDEFVQLLSRKDAEANYRTDFSTHKPLEFSLSLYCDDIELANPIGKHRKLHKLTIFYVQFHSLPSYMRSTLISVFPLAVVPVKLFKSNKKGAYFQYLEDFITSCNLLNNGVTFNSTIGCVKLFLKFVIYLGDTLASNHICGFKTSFAPNVFRCCRTCLTTNIQMSSIYREDMCMLRTQANHQQHILDLKNVKSKKSKLYWSRFYGINYESALLLITAFDIIENAPHDPMHILLEGLVPHELCLLMRLHICEKRIYSLAALNSFIIQFPYSYSEARDKPNICPTTFDISGSQTSAQILILARIIPLFIGQYSNSNDPYYVNFLDLLQILQLTLSPITTYRTILDLETLIEKHNKSFTLLWPNNLIPKHHFLLHFVGQMHRFGPLKNQFCMTFEAKHNKIKSVRWHNFKNIAKSVCQYLRMNTISNFLDDNGQLIPYPFTAKTQHLKNRIVIGSIVYQVGDIISTIDDSYQLYKITDLQPNCVKVCIMTIDSYIPHKLAFHVRSTNTFKSIVLENLQIPWPLTKFTVDGTTLVVPRSKHCLIVS